MDSIKKKLVLVVDDVEQNVAVVSQILRSHGYGVMAAFNGETALRMLEKRIPDLILLDIMMPVMDGFEVCAKIKENENLKNIPIIFLSALSDTDVKVKAFNVGGVDYVSKPFQEAEVIARVAVHIKIANLEREQREFIEKLTIMNDEKDRLMQIVSHDLRSPLGGIKGLSEILKNGEEAEIPEIVREFSEIIVQTSDTLLNLVNDLLDLAKIESGKQRLNVVNFDIISILQNSVRLQEKVAQSKGLQLVFQHSLPQSPFVVTADEPKITQVINNLLSNAIKFTPKGGSVFVTLSAHNDTQLCITVKDTGIGIPPEHLPKVFEKFGNHQRSGTSGEKGTGLGMTIVKRFVELHDGTIDVQSQQGVGTTFTIILPIFSEQKEE
ncbi:MAG TPA: hybrid sensor histidine kinase/response regulator [Candidatus Kapabacteria bacterium]|jgi:two-component system sensor histidine kinase/response regulator|nr:hybrid sensor histidine kinase/response regulator [Candidatus Kapabacteria bacterium]